MRELAIFLCCLFSIVQPQISFGGDGSQEKEEDISRCITPDGQTGECIGLRQCGNIVRLLRKPIPQEAMTYLKASICSFSGTQPDVCCPQEIPTFGPSTSSTSHPVEIPPECGQRHHSKVLSTRNAWPWQVAIGYRDEGSGNIDYLCGGSLITKRHVVTAAHCIQDSMETVLLGEHVLGNDTDGVNPEEYKIEKIIPHEDFNSRSFENDIAILKFDTDVEFKKSIQPVCLPSHTPGVQEEKFDGSVVHITGWGATSFRGPTSDILLQKVVEVTTIEECEEKFSRFENVEIGDTKICGRDTNGRPDGCVADSGGPMVIERRGSDGKYRFHLIGVSSFGYRCNLQDFPGVYTRVTEYDQWIRDKIGGTQDSRISDLIKTVESF